MPVNEFICPSQNALEDSRLGWLKHAVQEGETFLENQSGYEDIKRGKEIIAGLFNAKLPEQLSRVNVNLQKRLIRDVVSTMSNLRPLWGYSTDNQQLDAQAEQLNKLLIGWYQSTFADRGLRKGLQFAGGLGTGYVGPVWEPDFWTRGRGDIVLRAYGPDQVIPTQIPMDHDLQRAYAVTLKESVPINLARAMFPTMQAKIIPDRQAPNMLKKGLGRVSAFLSPVLNRFGANQRANKAVHTVFPEVDIFQTYIMDMSINEGPDPIVMGEPGTYWNYTVPVLNSLKPDGTRVTVEEARIYPWRRLITWCNTGLLRDNTSYWWHGMVPVVPLYFDDWAWNFLGYSMTRDLHSLEESSNTLRRGMDDSANARLRPALMHDDRTIANSLMESLDVRQGGQTVGVDFSTNERPIRPILDPGYYDVPQWIPGVIAANDEMMKYLSGVNDFTAVAKARQLPSSDTVEKIMEMAGPLVTDVSRNMEASLGKLGEMIKCLFFEFYTVARRVQRLGSEGVDEHDTDYFEPANMIPSHTDDDDKTVPSKYTQVQRAQRYMNSFFFKITPNSLHQITQMSRKLLYIQLQKTGMPIDPWTMATLNDLPNFGPPPAGSTTMMERWIAWEKMKGEITAHIQAKAMEIQGMEQMKLQLAQAKLVAAASGQAPGQGGPPPAPEPGSAGDMGGAPGPGPALGHNAPGRPPTFTGTPTIQSKDGGTRSTITSTPSPK